MNQLLRGLRAFGLSLLGIASLMAFMAAGAQANWLVSGVELAANETVAVEAHTENKFAVPKKNIEFRCKTVASEGLKLLGKSATAEGKIKFSSCSAFQISTGTENKNCKPKEPIVAGGRALIFLHNGKNYLLYHPETGKPFTTIEVSELCALTETSSITGTLVAECGKLVLGKFSQVDCKESEATHLIQPAPLPLFPEHRILFGANEVTTAGIVADKLSGVNAGKPWAGHV